jgi:hypothetical protein
VFQLYFKILFDYHFSDTNKSEESLIVVFDIMKTISNYRPFSLSPQSIKPAIVNSLEEISFYSFKVAFQTPIQINNSTPYSLFDLIQKAGKIGINLLLEMKIGFFPLVEENKEQKIVHQQIALSQSSFLDQEEEEDTIPQYSICFTEDDDEIFAYPLSVSFSDLSLFLDSLD